MSTQDIQFGLGEGTSVELYGPDDGGWYTTRVHDWIPLCPFLRDPDVRAYLVLRALVLEKYKNPVRKLTLAVLCELIPGPNGKPSSLTRVRGMLAGLSGAGLISTPEGGPVKTSSRAGAAQRTVRIRINDMPAEGYQGWRNAEVKLAYINKVMAEREAGRNSDPGGSSGASEGGAGCNSDPAGCNSDPGGSNSDPDPAPDQPEREAPLVPSFGTTTGGDALAARSGGDGRRPSSGSSVRAREGGFAASGKTSPSPTQPDTTRGPAGPKKSSGKKAAHTRQQLDEVRRVRALLPRQLLDAEGGLPDLPVLSDAILTAMAEGRTVEQMGERIWFRWSNHGFADQWAAAGRFEKPVGVARALVQPLRRGDRFACPDPRCENGADIDTGVSCRLCAVRDADRKAERARARGQKAAEGANGRSAAAGSSAVELPPQRPAQPRVLLKDCGNDRCSASIVVTAGPLCRDCEAAAAERHDLENAGAPAPF